MKNAMAFVLALIALISLVVLVAIGTIGWDVAGPLIGLIVGGSIGYLFPNDSLS